MTSSANMTVIFEKMLRFIEAEIKDKNCDDFFNDRDVIAFVDDNEFDSISVTRDCKKLAR